MTRKTMTSEANLARAVLGEAVRVARVADDAARAAGPGAGDAVRQEAETAARLAVSARESWEAERFISNVVSALQAPAPHLNAERRARLKAAILASGYCAP